MKRFLLASAPLAAIAALYGLASLIFAPAVSGAKTTPVIEGPLVVWSSFAGRLEPRNEIHVMSRFRGNAVLVELAPEGSKARKGGVLVRFDASALEREVLRLERDLTLARAELETLSEAKMPLQLRDLETKLMEARSSLRSEQKYLDTLAKFRSEGLVSEAEVGQQRAKTEEARTRVETLELNVKVTREHVHPSELKAAQAKLASAEQELRLAEAQLADSVVRAPADGVVVYKPAHVGEEFRPVRVGDAVFPNQPFMALTDTRSLVVRFDVPEEELGLVQEKKEVWVQPLAFERLRLRGAVESVGFSARVLPNEPSWKRFFPVAVGLGETDPRLKPGMSVTAHVLSHQVQRAVLVPRAAVRWEDDKPLVSVRTGAAPEVRSPRLGRANDEYYEVLEGLRPGEEAFVR